MFVLFQVEAIGHDLFQYGKRRPDVAQRLRMQRGGPWLAGNLMRTWCARITGVSDRGLDREFLKPQHDYRHSTSTGSRGVQYVWFLTPGIYEVNHPASWRRVSRYFIRVEDGKWTKIEYTQVLAALR